MDVMEAKEKARDYIIELFADEEVRYVGLEEAVYNPDAKQWRICYGFVRAWDKQGEMGIKMGLKAPRSYKDVKIDDATGNVVSLTDRILPDSAASSKPQLHSASVSRAGEDSEEKSREINELRLSRQDRSQVWRTIRRILLYPVSGTGIGSAIAILLQVIWHLESGEVAFIPMLGLGVGAIVALFVGDKEFQKRPSESLKT